MPILMGYANVQHTKATAQHPHLDHTTNMRSRKTLHQVRDNEWATRMASTTTTYVHVDGGNHNFLCVPYAMAALDCIRFLLALCCILHIWWPGVAGHTAATIGHACWRSLPSLPHFTARSRRTKEGLCC